MNVFKHLKGDRIVWIIMLLFSLMSVLVVYSAVLNLVHYNGNQKTSPVSYLLKHTGILAAGMGLTFLAHRVKYTFYAKLAPLGFLMSIPLLLFTLFKGVRAGEASRWIGIPGTSLTFQTSDFAKIMLVLFLARILAVEFGNWERFSDVLKKLLLPVVAICGLIFPANFSTAAVLFVNAMFLIFMGGVPMRHLFKLAGIAIVAAVVLGFWIWIAPSTIPGNRGPTWKSRIEHFSDGASEHNYQSEQSKMAIANGGMFGKGPGNSTQRAFLPQASSDFIFAIVLEEYGFLSGVLLLFLYLILLYRSVRMVRQKDKPFAGFIALGLSFSLVFQALINMGVAVDLFPVTGQPLPLISMGGTSILFTMASLGILLSVSHTLQQNAQDVKPE